MRKRITKPASVAAVVAAALMSPALGAPAQAKTEQSTASSNQPDGERKEFVVVAKDGYKVEKIRLPHDARVIRRFNYDWLSSYTVTMTRRDAAKLQADRRVDMVVENRVMPWTILPRSPSCGNPPSGQTVAPGRQCLPTGIDRIDADKSSTKSGDRKGRVPINVAVIDTGSGPNPNLNIVGGFNCTRQGNRNDFNDINGHGTHVAGTIGARDNRRGVVGVVPGARLWSVRIFTPNPVPGGQPVTTVEAINCGMRFVAGTHTDRNRNNDIQVANMSFGGSGNDSANCGRDQVNDPNQAVRESAQAHRLICRMVSRGVTPVAAAGNFAIDFANFTPATFREVLTVTAMADFDGRPGGRAAPSDCTGVPNHADDTVARFPPVPPQFPNETGSNFATGREDRQHTIAAPGACIVSTAPNGGYRSLSGTSMAAPHVAGTAALCIEKNGCREDRPEQTIRKLLRDAERYNRDHRGYGFRGDALHQPGNNYYGFLIRAARY